MSHHRPPLALVFTLVSLQLAGCGAVRSPTYSSYLPPPAPPAEKVALVSDEPDVLVDEVEVEEAVGGEPASTESYAEIHDNPFLEAAQDKVSTFSVDVDTASYANVRRFLKQSRLPPADAVRIEEMVNYFDYDYAQPAGETPFSATVEVNDAPWNEEARLVRIALKGRDMDPQRKVPRNFVFLIDTSGSMKADNKLPLLLKAMGMLTDKLGPKDTVSIVTYAGSAGLALPPTRGDFFGRLRIRGALKTLWAGGSTNGGQGIRLAYDVAQSHFRQDGENRVIIATDGDFNVGTVGPAALHELIKEKARTGVFLTVLGLGMGNYKDDTLEMLADRGNGNYAYLDSLDEAKKVLVDEGASTLVTLAKDVKLQVEWNTDVVERYRLIGYENRLLADEDFEDDKKDAGDIGYGHKVTALYEIVPKAEAAADARLLDLRVRYKSPTRDTSELFEMVGYDRGQRFDDASGDLRLAASVAAFGMLLRDSPHKGAATWEMAAQLAREAATDDERGLRGELVTLIERASGLSSEGG
jgi:Ca-activated chloride channel family protein